MYQKITETYSAVKLPLMQDAWVLFRFKDHEVIRLHLAPGESMENHINDWRIIFFVLRGRGTLTIEGSLYELETEQSIAVEAGKERFWSNPGDQMLELLVMKTREKE